MINWKTSNGLVDYTDALEEMKGTVHAIQNGGQEVVWLLEHPPLYTAGTSAKETDLIDGGRFPVYATGRGGQYTYHGPGQRVAYVMIDLNRRQQDLRLYVHSLEQWIIDTLSQLGVEGERREGRVGIWVTTPRGEEKIAAIGVRVSKWVTFHGIAINLNPDLSHFAGIVPCGLAQFGVTSLHQLEKPVSMEILDQALKDSWKKNEFLKGLHE